MVENRILLEFSYKKPTVEEAKRISEANTDDKGKSIPKNKDAAKAYRSHYKKQAAQFFIGGLICAVIGALSILVMVSGVDGPLAFLAGLSETLLGVLSIILPLAGLSLIVMAIVFFVKSNLSPSSVRPKSPEALFKMLFFNNVYFVDTSGSVAKTESNKAKWDSFAYTRLCRLVPENLRISQEQFNEYCSKLEKTVQNAGKTVVSAKKVDTMSEMKSGNNISVNNINELYHSVYAVDAVFTRSYSCFYDKFKNNATVILEFNIKGVLVKSGDSWYPYDLTPDLVILS